MAELYGRKVRITMDGLVLNPGKQTDPQLHIYGSVTKDISSNQNDGTVNIVNLAESSRNAVGRELKNIIIEAGYIPPSGAETFGEVARAQIRDVEHVRQGPEIITTITIGEGDTAARKATISKTIPAGTKVTEIFEEIAKEYEKQGIKRGEWKFPDDLKSEVRKRPVTMHGDARSEMDRLARSHGFYWNVNGEALEVYPADGFLGGVILLDSNSGLKGVPTITDEGVKASALFNPAIRPGRRVKIVSGTLEMNSAGDMYRVAECTYNFDSRSGDHDVQFTGDALTAGAKVRSEVAP